MELLIATFPITTALTMLGLYAVYLSIYRRNQVHQQHQYWSISILLDSAGLLLFGVMLVATRGLNQTSALGALSTALLLASYVYQALSFRALRTPISQRIRLSAMGLVLLLMVVWHLSKDLLGRNEKFILFGLSVLPLLCWQWLEIVQSWRSTGKPGQNRILLVSVSVEIFLVFVRIGAFAYPMPATSGIDAIPPLGLLAGWLQYAFKTISYAALIGNWTENLITEKTAVEMENRQFRELSARQEKMIADLQRMNKATSMGLLAAAVPHELGQPLQTCLLGAEMMRHELQSTHAMTPTLQSLMQQNQDNLLRLSAIIGTMRGIFSQADARPQKVDLFEVVRSLDLLVAARAKRHGIEVEYRHSGACLILANPNELRQILSNLIGNAFEALEQHSTPRPTVRITVTADDGRVRCTVEDNGPGIPADQLQEVFKIMKSGKSSGMGLGLWLTRFIAERNHGSIEAEASALGGACMALKFPAASA